LAFFIASLITACGVSPQDVDLDLNTTLPEVKSTVFNQAVRQLGKANLIYGRDSLHVMSKPVYDRTGTSLPTQGEIPQDISEMVKSTLNGFGGELFYIPYDPEFMLNTAQTGYSKWEGKILPNVILVGGLTEFDRGLVTKEEGFDISGSAEELGIPMGLDFDDTRKSSLARITLDFNLLDFETFIGIPFIQAVNTISVHKGLGVDQLGFTVYGQTLGLRGNIKKVQGRHAAVRLLVQLSVIQVIGKYQRLPYWRLLPSSEPDPVVLDAVREEFYSLKPAGRIAEIQEFLYLFNKDVEITGRLDTKTQNAIAEIKTEYNLQSSQPVSEELYLALFENVPLDVQTQVRRKQVNAMIATYQKNPRSVALNAKQPLDNTPANTFRPHAIDLDAVLGEVKVWTSKQEFSIGEPMEIFFEVTEPMFVRIVTVNSVGKMATLFPNPYQNDNFARPGKVYRIPPKGSPVNLTVGAPVGVDKIRAAASTIPISADTFPLGNDGEFTANADQDFSIAGAEFKVLTGSSNQAALNEGDQ
jgi:hypothetical protein